MSEELRPCPFCGGTKICTEKGINLNYCDNCSAESNVEHWNTRPIEDALNRRIAELEAQQRWIPVSERLPEKHECVLLLMKSKRYGVGVGIGHRLSSERHGWMVTYLPMPYDEITHWMPLPNPPEVNNE